MSEFPILSFVNVIPKKNNNNNNNNNIKKTWQSPTPKWLTWELLRESSFPLSDTRKCSEQWYQLYQLTNMTQAANWQLRELHKIDVQIREPPVWSSPYVEVSPLNFLVAPIKMELATPSDWLIILLSTNHIIQSVSSASKITEWFVRLLASNLSGSLYWMNIQSGWKMDIRQFQVVITMVEII